MAVYPTILIPLNAIAKEQRKSTKKTQAAADKLMYYLEKHPDETIRHHASDMVMHIHSDASYLSVSKSRSRLGGIFYCGYKTPLEDNLNGSILNVSDVINNVVA